MDRSGAKFYAPLTPLIRRGQSSISADGLIDVKRPAASAAILNFRGRRSRCLLGRNDGRD